LKHRGVPVYSVSSIFRPEQVFFKWYGRQYRRVLNCFTHFFVQNEISKELLAKIHITNVTVVGDTRFDRVLQIKEAAKQLPIVEAFKQNDQVFVAGSSWAPDEEIFIPYFKKHPEWKMIIAPHVIGEEHLRQIEKLLEGRKVVRYTEATETDARNADVLIIDCFGLLSSIYHYGEIAYVGGGFGVGIHNVLEAAVWDVPVFFGPNNQRFQEAQGLKAAGGGFDFETAEAFKQQMDIFLTDAEKLRTAGVQAGKFVQSLAGATEKVLSCVNL
jgi:3-deoxy-D-manno-octulosonic-acid transferase